MLIPLWIKVTYTSYAAVLVPVYWVQYGPANFLWLSDIAFLGLGVALWGESCFLASMMAAGTLLAELIWNADFFVRLFSGRTLVNIAGYMFDSTMPLYLRSLSAFHLLLPPLELWLLSVLGYDIHAWKTEAALASVVVPFSRLASDELLNVNWVYGPGCRQTRIPDILYIGVVTVVVIAGLILPGHLFLRMLFGNRRW